MYSYYMVLFAGAAAAMFIFHIIYFPVWSCSRHSFIFIFLNAYLSIVVLCGGGGVRVLYI